MAAKPILVIEKREKKELPLYIKDCKAEIFLSLKFLYHTISKVLQPLLYGSPDNTRAEVSPGGNHCHNTWIHGRYS